MDCVSCGHRMAYDGWNGWVWTCANCGRTEPTEEPAGDGPDEKQTRGFK